MNTKKISLLVLFSLFNVGLCNAQAAILVLIFGDKVASENFHLSLDLGVNGTFYTNAPGDVKAGWNFGLGTHTKISDKFQLVAEFKMLSDRSRGNTPRILPVPDFADSLISTSSTSWEVNNLDVPILLRYSATNKWHVSTGPMFSFVGKATEVTEVDLTNGNNATFNQNVKDYFNAVSYNWAFEVVRSFGNVRKGKGLDMRLRYNLSLSDVMSDKAELSSKANILQFIVTIPFIEVDNSDEVKN